MTIYDAAMGVLLVLGMVRGAWRGFTWQVASLGSLFLGYVAAHQISAQVAPYLPGAPEVQRIMAMAVVYIAVSGGIFAAAWMVRGTLRRLKFEAYDRHLGMLLGGAEAVGVGILATMFVVSVAPATREPIFASPSGKVMGNVMSHLGPVMPTEVRRVLMQYWHGEPTETALAGAGSEADAPPAAPESATPDAPLTASLPDLEEVAEDKQPGGKELPKLAPLAPSTRRDPALQKAGGKPSATQLESMLAKGKREIEQAVVDSLDDSEQKPDSLRQLAERDGRRIKDAVSGTVGQTKQRVGSHLQDRVSQGQQQLEKAIADSISAGQQKVEQAITDSIDQQLRRLGGLQPAAPAPAKKAAK